MQVIWKNEYIMQLMHMMTNDCCNISYLYSCLLPLGPRANSISDLWWMIWQEGVTHIIMLTNTKEGGKVGRPTLCAAVFVL